MKKRDSKKVSRIMTSNLLVIVRHSPVESKGSHGSVTVGYKNSENKAAYTIRKKMTYVVRL